MPIYNSNESPPGQFVQRNRDIQPDRADGRVIAGPHSGARVPVAGKWLAVRADLPHVHESHDTIVTENTLAHLHGSGGDGGAPGRLLIRELRPQRLVAVASHRGAAAGIEALVGREAEHADAGGLPDQAAQRQDAASVVEEVQIGRTGNLREQEGRAGRAQGLGRGEEDCCPYALRRIEHAGCAVVFQAGRDADQIVVAGDILLEDRFLFARTDQG